MLKEILSEQSLQLQAKCSFKEGNPGSKKRTKYLPLYVSCSISIILYGPADLLDEIGEFFQSYETYLQDPQGCALNVKYCNPHRLSCTDLASCPMTFELGQQGVLPGSFTWEEVPQQPDFLATIFNFEGDLAEAAQPSIIQTPLERHQKQALNFMLQRERGWNFDGQRPDIWDYQRTGQSYIFINRISGSHQIEPPRQFRGGIVADPMGLGKTLSMIALVATDLPGYPGECMAMEKDVDSYHSVPSPVTLIVVPSPLLDTWEEQLKQHVFPSQMSWVRHHGKLRLGHASELARFHLVLTSYHTILSEWRNTTQSERSILFSTQWRRIILDEAHVIRNTGTRLSKAICALSAGSRWAVTGTPVQNRLGDLAALLKFLQAHPYGEIKHFEADITHLWKAGQGEEAVNRLKRLCSCLLLRRSKETINLPRRSDVRCEVEFNAEERKLYDEIKDQAVLQIREVGIENADSSASMAFANFIQKINSLRIICNMGLYYHTRHDDHKSRDSWMELAQQAFNFQCEAGSISCHECSSTLDVSELLLGEPESQSQPRFSECLRFICSECSQRPVTCGHRPPHPIALVSTSRAVQEDTVIPMSLEVHQVTPPTVELPPKVKALVTQLVTHPPNTKSIVFSTWQMTLDIVQRGLKEAGIQFERFDGKVPQKDRQAVINRFRHDPSIRVLMLTLSCGAVGLTLTEASYAYLLEPHWNPTIEEQALARIHRIGQKNEVTTIRFFVRDTFEERVQEIQQSKKDLESLLFSPVNVDRAGTSLAERLDRLCSLL
ncbi:alpha-1,6-mannosyltransferase, variant 2 [Orbilia brochopaga]